MRETLDLATDGVSALKRNNILTIQIKMKPFIAYLTSQNFKLIELKQNSKKILSTVQLFYRHFIYDRDFLYKAREPDLCNPGWPHKLPHLWPPQNPPSRPPVYSVDAKQCGQILKHDDRRHGLFCVDHPRYQPLKFSLSNLAGIFKNNSKLMTRLRNF